VLDRIEKLCVEKGMRMTEQRRVIAQVLSAAHDHPDVEELHRRAGFAEVGRRQGYYGSASAALVLRRDLG